MDEVLRRSRRAWEETPGDPELAREAARAHRLAGVRPPSRLLDALLLGEEPCVLPWLIESLLPGVSLLPHKPSAGSRVSSWSPIQSALPRGKQGALLPSARFRWAKPKRLGKHFQASLEQLRDAPVPGLDLSHTRSSPEQLALLAGETQLEALLLRGCAGATPETLRQLPPRVRYLDLTDCKALGDAGCEALSDARELCWLRVGALRGSGQISATGLASLARVAPGLTTLGVEGGQLSAPDLRPLERLEQLVELELTGVELGHEELALLPAGVQRLAFCRCRGWSPEVIQALALACPRLTHLRIEEARDLLDPALASLQRFEMLQHLRLQGTTTTWEGLIGLRELPAIETVDLSDNSIVGGYTPLAVEAFRQFGVELTPGRAASVAEGD